jgi:hypothetical protein
MIRRRRYSFPGLFDEKLIWPVAANMPFRDFSTKNSFGPSPLMCDSGTFRRSANFFRRYLLPPQLGDEENLCRRPRALLSFSEKENLRGKTTMISPFYPYIATYDEIYRTKPP